MILIPSNICISSKASTVRQLLLSGLNIDYACFRSLWILEFFDSDIGLESEHEDKSDRSIPASIM